MRWKSTNRQAAWFASHGSLVLAQWETVFYEDTTFYKWGDGVTALEDLPLNSLDTLSLAVNGTSPELTFGLTTSDSETIADVITGCRFTAPANGWLINIVPTVQASSGTGTLAAALYNESTNALIATCVQNVTLENTWTASRIPIWAALQSGTDYYFAVWGSVQMDVRYTSSVGDAIIENTPASPDVFDTWPASLNDLDIYEDIAQSIIIEYLPT